MSAEPKRKILVTDDDADIANLMKIILTKAGYEIQTAADGEECLEKVGSFRPELAILDIMMPKLHGFDALKRIKEDEKTRDIGVILCSAKSYKPDIDTAMEAGAFGYIVKPFKKEELLAKVEDYFSKRTGEVPLGKAEEQKAPEAERYLPEIDPGRGYLKLWGTRGSIPVAGPEYVHFGGNTSCISFTYDDEVVIFDAGSGIREVGAHLAKEGPRKIHIFIGHTHWDHIQGFPFFIPAYIPGFELVIYGASGFGKDLESIFRGQLDKDYFPVEMEDMRATIEFKHVHESPVEIGPFRVYWEYTIHPGATLGFKIAVGDRVIGYISDNEFLQGYLGNPALVEPGSDLLLPHWKIVEFLSDIDLFVGEAQYTNQEYRTKIGWGHSSVSNACALARLAGIKRWIVTHHDPGHDDRFIQQKFSLQKQILEEMGHKVELSCGFDGRVEYL
jgi:CheY-like chemotaxis protein